MNNDPGILARNDQLEKELDDLRAKFLEALKFVRLGALGTTCDACGAKPSKRTRWTPRRMLSPSRGGSASSLPRSTSRCRRCVELRGDAIAADQRGVPGKFSCLVHSLFTGSYR